MKKKFVLYYHFNRFRYINLGIHFDFITPNIEIHIPFGFIKVGLEWCWNDNERFGIINRRSILKEIEKRKKD